MTNLTKICKTIERKTGIKGNYVEGVGIDFISFDDLPRIEFDAVFSAAYRLKNAHVECYPYTHSMRVFDLAEWDKMQARESAKAALVEGFWQAYHVGGKSAADAYYAENINKYREYGIA